MPVPQDRIREAITSLNEILTPNEGGAVTFGAKNEPFRLSQTEALQAEKVLLETGETTNHIVQPGGSGKTREGIALAYAMHKHGRNSLFVVPNQQTLEDFVNKARALCPDLDVGAVYQGEKRIGRLTFITYASLLRRTLGDEVVAEAGTAEEGNGDVATEGRKLKIDPSKYDMVIWDEAHMYLTANAQKLLEKFDHAINIGLTATPRYYQGKEVAQVFGKKAYELTLAEAKKRGEVCDYENLLVNTDIETGLHLSRPEQEESAEVARAINRGDRNRIIADLYRNAKIKVKRNDAEKEYTLTGEPTVVFGASIDHVHSIADAINAALGPLLKPREAFQTDETFRTELREKNMNPDDPALLAAAEEFRAALRAKGIDPDKVEKIIEPIHSGASDSHAGMTLDERNKLVERYHQRKVLMMAATSVLQQSFDSPMTSVVIDTVPRQTYVGVGQAAMRALRPGKDMAFIINMEDSDHQSLTLQDFENNRGHEEGIILELAGHGTGAHKRKVLGTGDDMANYDVTYGVPLDRLVVERRAAASGLHRGDNEFRHFTTAGYERLNHLIVEIGTGNKAVRNEIIEMIQPWVDRTHERLQQQIFEETKVDGEKIQDAVTDSVLGGIAAVEAGSIASWNRLNQRIQSDLRRRFEAIQKTNGTWEGKVEIEPLSHKRKLALPHFDKNTAAQAELAEGIEKSLKTLTPRERDAITRRHNGETLDEIAQSWGITKERVRQVAIRGERKLKDAGHQAPAIMEWVRDREMKPLTILLDQQANAANAGQRRKNNQILWEIEEELLVPPKKVIFDLLKCDGGYVPTTTIQEKTGVHETPVKALSDTERTNVNDLLDALDDGVITRLKTGLPNLGLKPPQIVAFTSAVAALKKGMARFEEMGGKRVEKERPIPHPIIGLDIPRPRSLADTIQEKKEVKTGEEKPVLGVKELKERIRSFFVKGNGTPMATDRIVAFMGLDQSTIAALTDGSITDMEQIKAVFNKNTLREVRERYSAYSDFHRELGISWDEASRRSWQLKDAVKELGELVGAVREKSTSARGAT